jgi:hypothetical protein
MKTEDVLKALRICRGAVDTAGIYPVFSHFCFNTDYVYGYNDVCAIFTELNSGISCALRVCWERPRRRFSSHSKAPPLC